MRPYFQDALATPAWLPVANSCLVFTGLLRAKASNTDVIQLRGGDHANVSSSLQPGEWVPVKQLDLSTLQITGGSVLGGSSGSGTGAGSGSGSGLGNGSGLESGSGGVSLILQIQGKVAGEPNRSSINTQYPGNTSSIQYP